MERELQRRKGEEKEGGGEGKRGREKERRWKEVREREDDGYLLSSLNSHMAERNPGMSFIRPLVPLVRSQPLGLIISQWTLKMHHIGDLGVNHFYLVYHRSLH